MVPARAFYGTSEIGVKLACLIQCGLVKTLEAQIFYSEVLAPHEVI
jgi:hypothetical protein